jgi:SOS response associated peptidase (SRAP)
MPVLLKVDDYDRWLDPGITNPARVAELLKPLDSRLMRCYPVSDRVNRVENDDEECGGRSQSSLRHSRHSFERQSAALAAEWALALISADTVCAARPALDFFVCVWATIAPPRQMRATAKAPHSARMRIALLKSRDDMR